MDPVKAACMQANATRDAARIAADTAARHARNEQWKGEAIMARCIEEFADMDESSLYGKSDKDLAIFQASHPSGSPQCVLALNEWNRRLVVRQVKATQHAAWIGLVGVIVGALMGWFLSSDNSPHSSQKNQDSAGRETGQQHHRSNPDQVAPKSTSQPPTK
jgi:hypothetical protein